MPSRLPARISALPALCLLAGLALLPSVARAQGFGDRLKRAAAEAAKRKTEEKVEKASEDATDAALDEAGHAAKKTVKKGAKGDATPAAPKVTKDADGAAADDTSAARDDAPAARPAPSTRTALVNFDFVPGTRVLFAEDFSRDEVGDFPRRLELVEGNAEVATFDGARWLRAAEAVSFAVPLPGTLPSRFTVEAEIRGFNRRAVELWFEPLDGNAHPHVEFNAWESGLISEALNSTTKAVTDDGREDGPATVRLMVDGEHVKAYVDGRRVANAPRFAIAHNGKLWIRLTGGIDAPVLLGNLRVMAGGRAMYEALASDGRVATQGLYFDTGRDVLRAESRPTLDEIGAMLKAHPELRLRIEGHTDDVGAATANQQLSERRAAAVRQALVSQYGIDAARLEAKGMGATTPVASNATGEGRQQNRRVELVKL